MQIFFYKQEHSRLGAVRISQKNVLSPDLRRYPEDIDDMSGNSIQV